MLYSQSNCFIGFYWDCFTKTHSAVTAFMMAIQCKNKSPLLNTENYWKTYLLQLLHFADKCCNCNPINHFTSLCIVDKENAFCRIAPQLSLSLLCARVVSRDLR